jgi:hypothetical protein
MRFLLTATVLFVAQAAFAQVRFISEPARAIRDPEVGVPCGHVNCPCGCLAGGICKCSRPAGKEPGHWSQFIDGTGDYAWWSDGGVYCGRWHARAEKYVQADGKVFPLAAKDVEPVKAAAKATAYYAAPAFAQNDCPSGKCR